MSRVRLFILSFSCCFLFLASPVSSSGQIGQRLNEMKKTDFFTWFNLVLTDAQKKGADTVNTFHPGTGDFRDLATVTVKVDSDDVIRAMDLTLERSFVDHQHNGVFARDIAKSFLRSATPEPDRPKIEDLATAIENPAQSALATAYLVYLGKSKSEEKSFEKSTMRIENTQTSGHDVLRISIRAR
jgi:hypothetical protein